MKYEAGGRHANHTSDDMGIVAWPKGLDRPFAREVGEQDDGDISASETTSHAGGDREVPRVKDFCREVAAPTKSSMARVKRLARYLAEYPRLVCDFGRKGEGARAGSTCSQTAIGRFAPAPADPQAGAFRFTWAGDQELVGHSSLCPVVKGRGRVCEPRSLRIGSPRCAGLGPRPRMEVPWYSASTRLPPRA